MDEEMTDYIRKQQETSNIGEIYQIALDTVFNPVELGSKIISYLTTVIEQFANDEDKRELIDFLMLRIRIEIQNPCMYKGISTEHYTVIESVDKWLSTQRKYYQNPKIDLLDIAITWEFSVEQQKLLFEGLIKDKFISDSCNYNDFCYIFGNDNYSDKKVIKRLMWIKNKQLLRELLEAVKNPNITKADMEKVVPNLFINKKGQPIELAKNKKVLNTDSDKIEELIRKIFPKKATIDFQHIV